jgi:hypothetical protein
VPVEEPSTASIGDIARLLEGSPATFWKIDLKDAVAEFSSRYLEAFSITCAMADKSAASPATPAHLDCAAKSVPRLNSLVRSASAKVKATLKAKPLAMKAEKKAIQKAAFLFIAPRKDILRRRVIAGQAIRPSKFPQGCEATTKC